jgi:nicotinamide mononucleotide (NMN) deamidase PncC
MPASAFGDLFARLSELSGSRIERGKTFAVSESSTRDSISASLVGVPGAVAIMQPRQS